MKRKRYITEWDRRHAWRIATRRCRTSLFAALGGAAGVALAIFTDAPPFAILAASLATYAACLIAGYYLAKRQLAE
jgi:uncharacterized membrane protein